MVLKPEYALGIFFVRETGLVEQIVVFDYYDENEEYKSIISDRRKLEDEKALLAKNMQSFLDAEEVRINGKPVYPRVIDVDIGFRTSYKYPYITYLIVFHGELKRGVNVYEDTYEPEVAEYNYRVYWIFPSKSRILRADLGVPYTLLDKARVLMFTVTAGTRIRGYERIEFEIL